MGKHRWPTAGDARPQDPHDRLPGPSSRGPSSTRREVDEPRSFEDLHSRLEPPEDAIPDEARSGLRWRVAHSAALVFLTVALAVGAVLFLVRSSEPSPAAVSVQLDAAAPAASDAGSPSDGSPSDGGPADGGDTDGGRSAGHVPRDGVPGVQDPEPAGPAAGAPPAGDARPGVVVLYLTGAVVSPGVFAVSPGTRLVDVIDRAGGPTPEADLEGINLAAPVSDGQHIHLLAVGEEPRSGGPAADLPLGGAAAPSGGQVATPGTTAGGGSTSAGDMLDINSADLAEIESLPRVGPVLGQRIIDWREENGPFVHPADIDAVPGIGPALLEGILPLIVVR